MMIHCESFSYDTFSNVFEINSSSTNSPSDPPPPPDNLQDVIYIYYTYVFKKKTNRLRSYSLATQNRPSVGGIGLRVTKL